MQHDVFISFSFQNQKEAEKIASLLTTEYGISCWICTRDISGGSHYKALIPDAIDVTKVLLLILSSEAIASKEVPKEVGIALDENKIVIPFKIDGAKLKGALRYDLQGVDYIDGTIPEFEDRIAELAGAINKAIGRPMEPDASERNASLKSSQIVFSDLFYGREALIRDIHGAYQAGAKALFLKGMGGIGKTELARQYIKAYRAEFDHVIFARYETDLRSLIVDDDVFSIHGVARKIKADGALQSDEEYAQEKLRLISKLSTEKTLIVIDNFDVMFDPYLEKICSTGEYRLLITTRCDQDTKKYRVIPVGELSDEHLKAFMIDCCEREYVQLEADDPGFPALFALTGRHTLTLELLAKYMCENSMDSVEELVGLLSENGFSLPGTARIVHDAKYTTVDNIIRDMLRMSALSDAERRFLHYLAMMPASGINQQFFKRWCGPIYAEARTRLLKLSLVKFDGSEKKLMLHPIIRQSILTDFSLSYDLCKPFIDAVVSDVSENIAWNYPASKKELLTRCCQGIMECFRQIDEKNYDAWYQMAVFLNFTDEYHACHRRFEALRLTAAELYGEDSVQSAQVLFRLGWLALNRVKYQTAQDYHVRALSILEKYKADVMGDYIHCLCDYSNSLFLEYKETKNEAVRAASFDCTLKAYEVGELAVRENLCPEALLRKGLAANTLVKHYMLTEQYAEAEEKLREALDAFEKTGDCFLDMASVIAKQGILYVKMGHPAAKECLLRAIALFDEYGSKYSGTYYECLWTLIEYLEEEGDLQNAVQYGERTLEYARLVYEEGHSKIVMLRNKVSDLTKKAALNA